VTPEEIVAVAYCAEYNEWFADGPKTVAQPHEFIDEASRLLAALREAGYRIAKQSQTYAGSWPLGTLLWVDVEDGAE